MDPLHGLLLERILMWCCVKNHSVVCKQKSFVKWKTLLCKDFDQTVKPMIWKAMVGWRNLPHMSHIKTYVEWARVEISSSYQCSDDLYTPLKIIMEHNSGGLVQMIFQTYNRRFLGSMFIFQGCTYCFIWNYWKICCSSFLKNFFWRVPVPHDLERIHTQIAWSPKKHLKFTPIRAMTLPPIIME